jgi:extracellular elastinolytic metalloproteinase
MIGSQERRLPLLVIAVSLVLLAVFTPARLFGQAQIFEVPPGVPDLDTRTGWVQPTPQQLNAVSDLGASARWNHYGTPQSLIKYGGYLATGLSTDPVAAARSFIGANAALFRLSNVQKLALLADNQMAASQGHAVTFYQTFGNLPATLDGMITVGVVSGKVAYVSSSAVDDTAAAPGSTALSPTQAWLVAATDAGRSVAATDITRTMSSNGWTVFAAAGFAFPQRSRLVAFPSPGEGVQAAYEVVVLDQSGGSPTAYKYFVAADTGHILYRKSAVSSLAQQTSFSGTYNPSACTTLDPAYNNGPFVVAAGQQSIDVVVSTVLPSNDIAINLIFGATEATGAVVGSSDVATSPEAIHYAPAGGVPPGNYFVQTCQSSAPAAPSTAPYTFAGFFITNDTTAGNVPYPPEWAAFPANPLLDYSSTDARQLWCWESSVGGNPVPGCQRTLMNLAARGPWDYDFRTNLPTFTTIGNAAYTAEDWLSPLAPGEQVRPASATRTYNFPWTNIWHTSQCDPTNLATPGMGNDIQASTANLFSMHNRMHDWSYFLGFTENNFNLQDDNFGVNAQGEHDPELGDVQAGAVSGGPPQVQVPGRDNANQITLNDGIPGITNQYLFESLPDAIYVPCVDGDFDMSVVGHEYTHAISHRMIGKAGSTISGTQGNSMGESWSDLDVLEYLHEFHFVPTDGENDFAEGVYVTGNKAIGIRNYAINSSPLNYGDFGYDKTGPEVHADGEIWNAVNFDIRQALMTKYNGSFPASNAALQLRCAEGTAGSNPPTTPLPPNQCPGNRRWIQIMYDAFLLENSGVSMLDARDAYLAADVMRFGGANQKELWHAFARRGFGKSASTVDSNDVTPIPGFDSPLETSATITFKAVASEEGSVPVKAKIYVGDYEARARPIADTDATSALSNQANLVPDSTYHYHFIVQADGYGMFRFHAGFHNSSPQTITLHLPTNWASVHKGAIATGDGTNLNNLIDDTENTDWTQSGAPVAGSQVVVQLGGGRRTFGRVQVSALMGVGESRFAGVRQFAVDACTASLADPNCIVPADFTTIFTSPADAFPSGIPRPLAPDLLIRSFTVPTTNATHVRFRVLSNQCTGGPAYNGGTTNDPVNSNTDCNQPTLTALGETSNPDITTVHTAEFEVFSHNGTAQGAHDPLVTLTMTAPSTATLGGSLNYSITYYNAGPAPSQGATITDALPWGVDFVSASNGATYNPSTRQITWSLGTVAVGVTGTVEATVEVSPTSATLLSSIVNEAEFSGTETTSLPTADAATLVLP